MEWFVINKKIQFLLFRKIICLPPNFKTNLIQNYTRSNVINKAKKLPLLNDVRKINDNTLSPQLLGEIKEINSKKQCLIQQKENLIYYSLLNQKLLVKVGTFIFSGDKFTQNFKIKGSGIITEITDFRVVLRKGLAYRLSNLSSLAVSQDSLVPAGKTLFHLVYKKEKTEDIVQGLPKIEELLEARRTKDLKPLVNNPHDRLKELFHFYKKTFNYEIAARKSLLKIQQFLVNGVQMVYQSQGVSISDKHIEIIVKQMTSKVFIEDGGQTPLLYGDLIEIYDLKKINKEASLKGYKIAKYEPILLGITKASLKTESFLSAASFQETTRVLTQAAIQGKFDNFKGLKENVVIGRLIPAGTGFKKSLNQKH